MPFNLGSLHDVRVRREAQLLGLVMSCAGPTDQSFFSWGWLALSIILA